MIPSARNVLAKYLGDGEEEVSESWMQHVEQGQNTLSVDMLKRLSPSSRREYLKGEKGDAAPALVDFDDAASRSKKIGPVFNYPDENRTETGNYPIQFSKPSIFNDDGNDKGILSEWWQSRHKNDDSASGPFRSDYLTGGPVEASVSKVLERHASEIKVFENRQAKTLQNVINDNAHVKRLDVYKKSKGVRMNKVSTAEQETKGLYVFKTQGLGSVRVSTTVLQFVKHPSDEVLGKKSLMDHHVLIGCNCPAFLFWGAQYYAARGGYMYHDMIRPSIIEPGQYIKGNVPVRRGRGMTYCKHLLAVANHVGALNIDEGYSDNLREKILHVKDPEIIKRTFDAEAWKEAYELTDINSLQVLAEKKLPSELLREVEKILRSQGWSMNIIQDFLNADWQRWTDEGDEKKKADFIRSQVQAPSLVLYLLIEEHFRTGKLNPAVLRAGFDTLDKVLNFRSNEVVDKDVAEKGEKVLSERGSS